MLPYQKTTFKEQKSERGLHDSSNLVREAKVITEYSLFMNIKECQQQACNSEVSPSKMLNPKHNNKKDYLTQLRAKYVPEHSSSNINLEIKQPIFQSKPLNSVNQNKVTIEIKDNYYTSSARNDKNKTIKTITSQPGLANKLLLNTSERHRSSKISSNNPKSILETREIERSQSAQQRQHRQQQLNLISSQSKPGLNLYPESYISKLRPRQAATESYREAQTEIVDHYESLREYFPDCESRYQFNQEETESLLDVSM